MNENMAQKRRLGVLRSGTRTQIRVRTAELAISKDEACTRMLASKWVTSASPIDDVLEVHYTECTVQRIRQEVARILGPYLK